jgi:hypothetical protein
MAYEALILLPFFAFIYLTSPHFQHLHSPISGGQTYTNQPSSFGWRDTFSHKHEWRGVLYPIFVTATLSFFSTPFEAVPLFSFTFFLDSFCYLFLPSSYLLFGYYMNNSYAWPCALQIF